MNVARLAYFVVDCLKRKVGLDENEKIFKIKSHKNSIPSPVTRVLYMYILFYCLFINVFSNFFL